MLKSFIKLGGLIVYAIIFGEMFLRIMAPQPIVPRYVTGAADGVRANIPNVVYRQKTPEVDVELRINAQGIRADREFSVEKPEDTFRIVLLGDSFFMGYEVELEQSLARLLEKKLLDKGVKAEVINLAVSGFGTAENLVALRERGLKYNPDLVVMEWHATDPADNIRSNLFRVVDDHLEPTGNVFLPGIAARDALMKLPGYAWLIGNSHLYSAVREKAAVNVKKLLVELNRLRTQPTPQKPGKPSMQANLDELLVIEVKREAERHGAEFVLLDVPIKQSRISYKRAVELLPLDNLTDTRIVSPLEAFHEAAAPDMKLYFEKGHGHWTPEGNRIVAELLVENLVSQTASYKPDQDEPAKPL